ncbi:MAG TPA: protein-glutamate O-methyltransferase CheR [Polyangiaceae bacterium]
MRELTLSSSLFAILSGLVEERTGMHYERHDLDLFSGKLLARAIEAGFESPLDYYYFLRYDDRDRREFDALVDSLVVNETYFFREVGALRVLCDDVLARSVSQGRRPRVWCAACATGEEPLTLAMLLSERGLLAGVEIVASDISLRALARAREALYGERSLRGMTAEDRSRWLVAAGEKFTVRREIHDAITWNRVNLVDPAAVAALGSFDVILCRNVLIYFGEDTMRQVVSALAGALAPDGRLLVGTCESLLRFGTLLECEERGGSFFYKKIAP